MRFIDLQEGPNDPGIFKAVFLAGGPGSGKSFVATQLGLASAGLRVVNSDDALEYLMQKHDLDLTMPAAQQAQRDVARQRAKEITKKKQNLYLDGRLGLVIDGTAKDVNKMAKLKAALEDIGYQTAMVFVNTSLKTAMQRNNMRPRRVPSDIVVVAHKQVQQNKEMLKDLFGGTYHEVSNEGDVNFSAAIKFVDRFLSAPISAKARDWVSRAQVQKTVKEELDKRPKVYVDMDGVLANFYAGVTAVTGHAEPRDLALQDMEDTMASFKGTDFFYQLPKYEQTDQLIAMVNAATDGDWYILSSPLKYDREGSAVHKARWIKDKLNIQPRGMHFTGDKAKYAVQADGTPNILIDDYPKYLNSWKDAGGIGVQYKGHAGNIADVEAVLAQNFSKKKVTEETRSPGEYVYHASYVGNDKARWLRSLIQRGLRPSDHGYSGPGTYFAYEPDEGYYHVTPEDSIILRVKWKDLASLFGVYPANPNGIERDDEEIIVPGTVPAGMIEVEYFENEWWDLKSALEAETYQYETTRNVNEDITQRDLDEIERYADKLFGSVGIDVSFTRHFLDRVNDERNRKPISAAELIRLFRKEYQRWGRPIAQMGPDAEAVLKDMQTDINVPFVLKWDSRNNELDLVAKTVMRKPDFRSPDPVFPVGEDVTEDRVDELNVSQTLQFIKQAHGDQLYGKLPYWTHPRAVALTGRKIFGSRFNSDAIKAAFLHDVVEDTNISLDEISKLEFSPEVIEAVSLLTKDKSLTYKENIERILNSGNQLAMMVKYADNYENYTGDKSDWDPAKADSSQKKYLRSLNMLGDALGVQHHIEENFADGKKPGRKGLAKRVGVDCSKSETELRKIAKRSSGEKQRIAHWCANMKGGKKK